MSKQRRHRVCVYVLDPDRRRILLQKTPDGPFKGKFGVIGCDLDMTETPAETVRRQVRETCGAEIEMMSYATSNPLVLDSHAVKLNAPLFIQVTHMSDDFDHVDYVFLACARERVSLEGKSDLSWFNTEELVGNAAPRHVKLAVREILTLINA